MLYRFENYALDTDRRELRCGAACVELEPQVFDLLEYLLRTRERVASRDDLLAAVWNGRIVSESTLSSRINAARAAIGDDGARQRLIKTLPRKGIRFVGEVREGQDAGGAPVAAQAAARDPAMAARPATVEGPSIAVLPFTNMSGDAQSDYFADGMAEEIITALARCGGILVIARNSTFTYKGRAVDVRQVGRELGVGYVLEGSVRRKDDWLRITAQLIEAETATHLWADRFDGSLSEVFALQDRIAESAAAVIEPRLRFAEVERVRRKPPQSLAAYDLWLRAMSHASEFTHESMATALGCLEQAMKIDPHYALAMASAAYYQAQCHFQGWQPHHGLTCSKAVRMALDAVELARDDGNVLWMSGFTIWTLDQDGERARAFLQRSLEINPNSAIALTMAGWVEAANGSPAHGRELLDRSRRLNPRHPRAWFNMTGTAIACLADGNYPEAITWAEKALSQNRRFAVALRALAVALVNVGEIDKARQVVRELLAIEPQLTVAGLGRRLPFVLQPLLATYMDALGKAGLPAA